MSKTTENTVNLNLYDYLDLRDFYLAIKEGEHVTFYNDKLHERRVYGSTEKIEEEIIEENESLKERHEKLYKKFMELDRSVTASGNQYARLNTKYDVLQTDYDSMESKAEHIKRYLQLL